MQESGILRPAGLGIKWCIMGRVIAWVDYPAPAAQRLVVEREEKEKAIGRGMGPY